MEGVLGKRYFEVLESLEGESDGERVEEFESVETLWSTHLLVHFMVYHRPFSPFARFILRFYFPGMAMVF